MNEAVRAIEEVFKAQAEGRTNMPPKLYLELPDYSGDFRAMPAQIEESVGLKWVSVYPNNPKYDLPTVVATIILCDPRTGCPVAIMDGTHITNMRTGAAGGVAAKYLARNDSSIIGMVGAGVQARAQLMAIIEVLPTIKEVKVFDRDKLICLNYIEELGRRFNVNIHLAETIEAATEADIIVTTTPSREPIIKKDYIQTGTHINAIGADGRGKQELEPNLLLSAKIVVDDIEQACHSGEINIPVSNGTLKRDHIYSTLGNIVANFKKGRENDEEITIFDSTGLGIQDIVCAKIVYEKAKLREIPTFKFF
jgi:alanine dehydrogenase